MILADALIGRNACLEFLQQPAIDPASTEEDENVLLTARKEWYSIDQRVYYLGRKVKGKVFSHVLRTFSRSPLTSARESGAPLVSAPRPDTFV